MQFILAEDMVSNCSQNWELSYNKKKKKKKIIYQKLPKTQLHPPIFSCVFPRCAS